MNVIKSVNDMVVFRILCLSFVLVGCTASSLVGDVQRDAESVSERLSWVGSATLAGVNGVHGNGFAELEIRNDSVLSPSIRVQLPVPPDGALYEAWLFRENPSGSIHIGPLIERDTAYYLGETQIKASENLRPYTTVAITIEPRGDDNSVPSTVVAKGFLVRTGGMGLRSVEFP